MIPRLFDIPYHVYQSNNLFKIKPKFKELFSIDGCKTHTEQFFIFL